MNIPLSLKPALWGIAGGAFAMAIIGFTWGGWTTARAADTAATMRINSAVVSALAPVCADKFRRAPDAAAQLSELKKADTWSQGDFVEKGGWTSVPGTQPSALQPEVARACAVLLVA